MTFGRPRRSQPRRLMLCELSPDERLLIAPQQVNHADFRRTLVCLPDVHDPAPAQKRRQLVLDVIAWLRRELGMSYHVSTRCADFETDREIHCVVARHMHAMRSASQLGVCQDDHR